MKYKDFSQDEYQKPPGATRQTVIEELNQTAVNLVLSPEDMAILDCFTFGMASTVSMKLIPERASSTSGQVLHEIHNRGYNPYAYYGLNE